MFALAALLYANTGSNDFVLDDRAMILENSLIRDLRNLPTLLVSDYWEPRLRGGLYRPLVTISYALNYALSGADPVGYHS